jgi:hypothetical protein
MLKEELDSREVDWLAIILVSATEAIICNGREHRNTMLKVREAKVYSRHVRYHRGYNHYDTCYYCQQEYNEDQKSEGQ